MTADINEVVAQIRKGDKIGLLVYLHHGGDANARNSMGWTLLHIACFEGKTEIVQILLDNGAQVNACTTDMATPLHRAASQGCKGAVAALLNKNAYVNAQDKNGNTALHEAAKGAFTSIVKALINQKADKDKLNNRKQRFTDLVGQQLMPAVASGDTETLTQWLDWGLSPNTCGSLGWSLLHHACVSGQTEVAALLIDRGANLETLDSNKSSALHAASFHGSKDIVKLLLKNGANPNLQDQRGNTSLHSAVSGSHAEVINLLLEGGADTSIANNENMVFKHIVKDVLVKTVHEGKTSQVAALLKGHADPDTRDVFGTPLICVAAFNKDLLVVDALLEAGADPNLSSTDSKKTALHYAAFWDDLFIIKSLLDRKAKVDPVDRFGNTPLHDAANEGRVDVITMLTGRLAAINIPNLDGNTPLHLAARAGETAAVELLLEKGANESFRNKNGQLYSDLALINAVRTEVPDKVTAGLAWGGDPNTKDHKGWTLLHHAVFKGSLEITSMLLECGAEVDEVDIHGRTALILAAYRGNCTIASRLLEAGAHMERQDRDGQTALHWAAREGSVETVLCLIDRGADTAIKDNAGRFFKHWLVKHLYLAVRHTDFEKVEALLSVGADQFAKVEGTDVTPREEAKRRKSFSILKLMAARAQLTQTYEEEFDFWNMPAIEDLRVLFKGEDSSDEDSDEDAEWKMKNAEVVLSAKELFADDNEELWEVWDEKPKWITAKELHQEDVEDFWQSWEDTPEKPRQRSRSPPPPARSDDSETESDEETEESEDSNEDEVRKPLEELQQDAEGKFFFAIPAKELFKEDSSWLDEFDDSKYCSSKAIPAKEAFKEEESWLESEDEDEYKPSKAIPAKEAFKEDYSWLNDNEDLSLKQSTSKVVPDCKAFNEDDTWLNSDDECEYSSTKAIPANEAFKEDDSWLDSDGDSTLAIAISDKDAFKEDESLLNSDDESGYSLPKAIGAKEAFKEDDSWLHSEDSESSHSYSSDDQDAEHCERNQFSTAPTDEVSLLEEEDDSGYSSTKLSLPKEHSEGLSQSSTESTSKEMRDGVCLIDELKASLTSNISTLGGQDSGDDDGWKKNCEVSQPIEKRAIAQIGNDNSENIEDSQSSSDESITNTEASRDGGNASTSGKLKGKPASRIIRKNLGVARGSMMTDTSSQEGDSSRQRSCRMRMRSHGKSSDFFNGNEIGRATLLSPVKEDEGHAEMQHNVPEVDVREPLEDSHDKTPKSFSECFGFAYGRPANSQAHDDPSSVQCATNSHSSLSHNDRKHSLMANNTCVSDVSLAYSLNIEDCFDSKKDPYMSDVIHKCLPTDGKDLQYTPFYKVSSNKNKLHFETNFTASKDGLLTLNSDYNSSLGNNQNMPRSLTEFKTGGFGSFRFCELMTRDESDYKQLERTEGLGASNPESCSQVCLLSEPEVVQRVLVRIPAPFDSSLEEMGESKPFVEEYKGMNAEDDPRVTELFDEILLNLLDYHPEQYSVENTATSVVRDSTSPRHEITAHVSTPSDALASDEHENNLDMPNAVTQLISTDALDESPVKISETEDGTNRKEEASDFTESDEIPNTMSLQNDRPTKCDDRGKFITEVDVTSTLPRRLENDEDVFRPVISQTHADSIFSDDQTRVACSLQRSTAPMIENNDLSILSDTQTSTPPKGSELSVNKIDLIKCHSSVSRNETSDEIIDERQGSYQTNLSLTDETNTMISQDLSQKRTRVLTNAQARSEELEDQIENASPSKLQPCSEGVDNTGRSLLPSISGTQRKNQSTDVVPSSQEPSEDEVDVIVPVLEDNLSDVKSKSTSSSDGNDSALISFISFCVFILFITSYLLFKWLA